jgi:hypothetical protein
MGETKTCPQCDKEFTRPASLRSQSTWESRVYCSPGCAREAAGEARRRDMRPWEGTALCIGQTGPGQACQNREIEGLEFCLHHIPEDMLEEAEEVTGLTRCRARYGQPDHCTRIATRGTVPPVCASHGARQGSLTSQNAARRVIEDQAINRLEAIMSDDADAIRILNPEPIGNPLTALLDLAAEIRALREIMRDRVFAIKAGDWRYRGREAEMVRAEIILYERAQEREAHILIQIAKLKIDERLAAISERRMARMEQAMDIALKGSGLDLAGQEQARQILRRELTKAS